MSTNKPALNRKNRGRVQSGNKSRKSAGLNVEHYLDTKRNYRDGLAQEAQRTKAEERSLSGAAKCVSETLNEPKRVEPKEYDKWLDELVRDVEKYRGFGVIRCTVAGERLPQRGAISESESRAFLEKLCRECYYWSRRSDRPNAGPRKVWPGLSMVTVTREAYAERAIQRGLRFGAIPVDRFLAWHLETMLGFAPVLRSATAYRGAPGLELELVASHGQQSVFHDHLFCRGVDLETHSRLGYIGVGNRLVWNSLGMSLIGARRQRRLGLQPVPLLQTSKKAGAYVVNDWSTLDWQIRERTGEAKTLEEKLSEWRSGGSDPRKDPRLRSRNLELGKPWDICANDYVDGQVTLLRREFPEAECFFQEELEAERVKNRHEVREAHLAIFRELLKAGWTRKEIEAVGIDVRLDPVEAARAEAVRLAEKAERRAEDTKRDLVASQVRVGELELKLAELQRQVQAVAPATTPTVSSEKAMEEAPKNTDDTTKEDLHAPAKSAGEIPAESKEKKALITLNRIALGERVDYNTEVREAVITVNSVNLDREHGFIVGKLGNIELHPDFYKSVDASERKEAEELINAAAKGRELFAKAKNTVDAWSLGKNGNIRASADFFKTLTGPGSKQLVAALEKGDEFFKDGRAKPAAKAENAPAPAAAPAAEPAKAEAPKLKLVAQEALDALKAGNEALSVGKPIAEALTPRQLQIVEIKGPTRLQRVQTKDGLQLVLKDGKPVEEPNPAAGRLGLTMAAFQSVSGNIALAKQILGRDPKKLSTADAAAANLRLTSFTEVLEAAKASMGISKVAPEVAPETPAQAAPEQEPAHTMAP